jgi:hypothetical protein
MYFEVFLATMIDLFVAQLLSSDAPENAVIPTDDVQLKNELVS